MQGREHSKIEACHVGKNITIDNIPKQHLLLLLYSYYSICPTYFFLFAAFCQAISSKNGSTASQMAKLGVVTQKVVKSSWCEREANQRMVPYIQRCGTHIARVGESTGGQSEGKSKREFFSLKCHSRNHPFDKTNQNANTSTSAVIAYIIHGVVIKKSLRNLFWPSSDATL